MQRHSVDYILGKVKSLDIKLYARPKGFAYHTDKNCPMLSGDQFAILGYKEITTDEVVERGFMPCHCTMLAVELGHKK